MPADNAAPSPRSPRRARSTTNPPQRPHHRRRPSLDHSLPASRSSTTTTRPSSSRHSTDKTDRSSTSQQQQQQQQPLNSPPSAGSSRPRGLSISSPFQVASPSSQASSPLTNEYFSLPPTSSGSDARSPAAFRRPPASHSSHGLETSRGPPIALISRGSYSADIARHIEGKSQSRADFGLAQQQLVALGLISPGGTPSRKDNSRTNSRSSSATRDKRHPSTDRQESKRRMESDDPIGSSFDELSENEPARGAGHNGRKTEINSGHEPDRTSLTEDLFLKIAEDSPPPAEEEKIARRKSRIARASQRQSLPTNTYTPPHARPDYQANNLDNTPPLPHQRRASQIVPPSINTDLPLRQQSPMSSAVREHRVRQIPQPSSSPMSYRPREHDITPVLSQPARRRPSNADSNFTPPGRSQTYKRSNLQYTSSSQDHVLANDSGDYGRTEGTESVDSGPAPSTVWDELDELKTRIRQLEGQHQPPSSAAAASNASNERPRTATTTVTTISSSPKQRRKAYSPSDPAVDLYTTLDDALARCKEYLSPTVHRSLQNTVNEALELAALTGTSGPQGTANTVASMVNGANSQDRQVRRRAYNVCQSLTELCVTLCEGGKVAPVSPFRQLNQDSRRSSMQFTGEMQHTPNFAQHARSGSVEPDGAGITRSPSRALSRVQERRTSYLHNGLDRASRHASEEPATPSASRFNRTGTSLLLARSNIRESPAGQYDDDEDSTVRVPSRAMTEYVTPRPHPSTAPRNHRNSREYTSQEPLPHFQSSPLTQAPTTRHTYVNSSSTIRDNGARKFYDRGPQATASFERNERDVVIRSGGEERRRLTQPGGGRYDTTIEIKDSPVSGVNRHGSLGRRAVAPNRRFGTTTSSSVNSSVD